MDSATRQMLDNVRKRIANLQKIEQLVLEEYGEESSNGTSTKAERKRKARTSGGRKTEIHSWLKKNGPATRTEIIEGTKLPAGTISGYLSAEKDLFESRDGKWHAR
jgi:hypothetical protein